MKKSNEEITAQSLRNTTSIGGWLIFCFFQMIVGNAIGLITTLINMGSEEASLTGLDYLFLGDLLLTIIGAVLAVVTIVSFVIRRRDAVAFARCYMILLILSNILSIAFSVWAGNYDILSSCMSCVVAGAWIIFFSVSENVQELIPDGYSKTSYGVYAFIAAIVLIPLPCYIIGFVRFIDTYGALLS